jgi:penicillin-binding protein 1C
MNRYPRLNNFFTTLSHDYQNRLKMIAGHSLQELSDIRVSNLAIIVIDNKTNNVIAYEGNAKSVEVKPKAQYLDLAIRPRSTGSILKPFLFGQLLDEGLITPTSLISDIPTYFEGFRPKNFVDKYAGVVPANTALAQSLNIPAVRMLKKIGTSLFYDLLKNLGFKNINRGVDNYGVSIILGGAEENLWRITNAYSQMANVVRSMDQNISPAKWLKDSKPKEFKFPLSIGASFLTLKSLLEVNRPGESNHWKKFATSQHISWKTGTSQGFKDAWSVGTNGRYTVGVWTGNANGVGSPNLIGVRAAAPVMFRVFNSLPRSEWFSKPSYDLKGVAVCQKSGYRAHSNCPTRMEYIPSEANFNELDSYYKNFNLDKQKKLQVDSSCYKVSDIEQVNRFVLTPIQAYYYRRTNLDYKTPPIWKEGCISEGKKRSKLSILYPSPNIQIYIPRGLDGKKNKIVLKAAHHTINQKLFWHLDQQYLGETSFEHHQEVSLKPGKYQLMITDETGASKKRWFSVLKN